jgi:hypothetical protein
MRRLSWHGGAVFFFWRRFWPHGQGPCGVRHLAIFEANLAEILEERTLDLQPGSNTVEWRSLMPQAVTGSLRVTAEQVRVVRQGITFDGAEVRNQRSPVLHLVFENAGASGPRKVQVDYLAPRLSWKSDYSLVLGVPAPGGSPVEMLMDGWISVRNETGMDVCADAVDLVAGEIQLLAEGRVGAMDYAANAQTAFSPRAPGQPESAEAEVLGLSVFSRIGLGRNIAIPANTAIGRFPLFQRLKLGVEQRNIFENDARTQTLGRGGFMLAPRGLEVRLVSRNNSASVLPGGTVTVYSQEGGVPQVVGQDRIPLTPAGADFSLTQGRSNVLQGTRRVVDRREVPDPSVPNRLKLVTQVEVVITNRSGDVATAFVREGVENWGRGEWNVTESSQTQQRLGDRMMEFRVRVPANGNTKVAYTVEVR